MFSFHKPKIYRSNLGCCICKAKSSSSRFTDSKKYENEFERCFRIEEQRSGEICNACVLLVKRWKKLSPENRLTKHWHHVVDARAGPGTKLTSGRRFTGPSHAPARTSAEYQSAARKQSAAGRPAEVLPLSSSQAGNQTTGATTSSSSGAPVLPSGHQTKRNALSNKSRDLSSSFNFESARRSYMAQEPNSSSLSLNKPQSALNSSAFESVIKRFRQRQQQQQLEAQRRLMNRKQRATQPPLGPARKQLPTQLAEITEPSEPEQVATKRVKRSSESIGSLCVDGLRVSTLLDCSMWRKEKICCGTIFRGKYNEIAIFPKLLKPCPHRVSLRKPLKQPVDESPVSPPPRATKSGSISSCGSSATSGTGSMEVAAQVTGPPISSETIKMPAKADAKRPARGVAKKAKQQKPTTGGGGRGRRPIDTESTGSSCSSSFSAAANQEVYSPGGSTNSNSNETSSTSRLISLAMGDEACAGFDELDEEDEAMAMAIATDDDEDAAEETDASSSVESITGGTVERKKSSVVGAMG